MARSYALHFRYNEAIRYYDMAEEQSSSKEIDKCSLAYYKLNSVITRGYIGKYDEGKFEKQVKPHLGVLSKKATFEDDLIKFTLALADVAFNNRVRGLSYHIKNLNLLLNKYPQKVTGLFLFIRLGILHFIQYLNSGDKKVLQSAEKYFSEEIKVSEETHYKNYWARCGYVVCLSLLNKKIDSNIIKNPPYAYKARIKDFPIIWYLLAKSRIITGNSVSANRLFRDCEKQIDILLDEMNYDVMSQSLMISKYKILRDEWINLVYSQFDNNDISMTEACKRIIKVNEIFNFRQLKEKVVGSSSKKNNLENALSNLQYKSQADYILYATDIGGAIGFTDRIFIITIDINNKKYQLKSETGDFINKKVTTWRKLIKHGQDQDTCLSFLESIINLDMFNKKMKKPGKIIVIPNQLLLEIPFGLLRTEKSFYHEKYEYEYWPSLNLASQIKQSINKKLSASIYYDKNENNARKEAGIIKSYLNGKVKYSGHLIEISADDSDSNILHFIFHYDGINAIIDGKKIPYQNIFEKKSVKEKVIILNICKGGNNILKSSLYDSLPTYLISRGADAVISHNWELSQEASLNFTDKFYMNLKMNRSLGYSFSESLKQLSTHNVIEYGGYTLWGNGQIGFN